MRMELSDDSRISFAATTTLRRQDLADALGEMSARCVLDAQRFWCLLAYISEWATFVDADVAIRGKPE